MECFIVEEVVVSVGLEALGRSELLVEDVIDQASGVASYKKWSVGSHLRCLMDPWVLTKLRILQLLLQGGHVGGDGEKPPSALMLGLARQYWSRVAALRRIALGAQTVAVVRHGCRGGRGGDGA